MLTVKIIDSNGENIFQTRHVDARTYDSRYPHEIDNVNFQADNGAEITIQGGGATIYVMNDNGKTVSTFHLGGLLPDGESVGVK